MNTFTYFYPVKTFFGEGAARDNLPDLLAKYGQNVMLAYGGGSVKGVGIFDEMADSTVITKGCCKGLTADEIFEILQECL